MSASMSFGDSMRSITLWTLSGWFLLSMMSGVTALLWRIDNEQKAGRRPMNLTVFAGAHIGGSLMMGLVALFGGEGLGAPGWATALSMILLAGSGAVGFEMVVRRRLQAELGTTTGLQKPNGASP